MPNTNFQTFHQMGQAINEVVRQATGRDAVQNIDMDHVTVAQNSYYEEMTASGSMVSFTDRVGGMPLEKCVVQIEPVQDLHGYDHPWAGGAGKNLFAGFPQSPGYSLRYYSLNIGNGTFTMSTTMPLQADNSSSNLFILPGQVETGASSSRNGVSIGIPRTVDSVDGYITIAYRNANGVDPADYNIQIEQGSIATAYEPYSNICPITGWTGANIYVSPTTDAQDGTTYSITFPDEAGTVYGGTLTINEDGSGEIVVNKQFKKGSDCTWIKNETYQNTFNGSHNGYLDIDDDTSGISSEYIMYISTQVGEQDYGFAHSNQSRTIYVRDINYSELQEFISHINNVDFVFGIKTPFSIPLTTDQIKTIQGQNNIWADTGDIEVKVKLLKELY